MKSSIASAYFFIFAAIIATALELFGLSMVLHDTATVRLRLVLFAADAAVIYFVYWLMKPRWRWILIVLCWLVSIYTITNTLYFRYWGDMYTMPSIFESASYNSFVIRGAASLWSWIESLMLAVPVGVTVLYFILKPYRCPSFSPKIKAIAAIATVGFFAFGFYFSARSMYNWNRISGRPEVPVSQLIAHRYDRQFFQFDYFHSNGLIGYIYAQIINYPRAKTIDLSDKPDELASIEAYLRQTAPTDSVVSANRGKNLIFIIVESLNAGIVNQRVNGHEITPNLNRMLGEQGSVYCLDMYAQIAHGGSSDGQLIYNTGLLPVASGVTVQSYLSSTFPSLVKALEPASSAEFIVENAMVYNHRNSSKAFGYDTIYDSRDLFAAGYDPDAIGSDRAVMSFAYDKIKKMPQPFVAEITTLSMHYPFDIKGFEPAEWIDSIAPGDYYRTHYLQTAHYTDAAIGEFVNRLKNTPLWDNTVIVIASDHDTTTEQNSGHEESAVCEPIVFMALNTGVNLRHTSAMGQIDVYPSVLDIMGIEPSADTWPGLGQSILSSTPPTATVTRTRQLKGDATDSLENRLRRAYTVSDTLIRSNYFEKH